MEEVSQNAKIGPGTEVRKVPRTVVDSRLLADLQAQLKVRMFGLLLAAIPMRASYQTLPPNPVGTRDIIVNMLKRRKL